MYNMCPPKIGWMKIFWAIIKELKDKIFFINLYFNLVDLM